MLNNAPFSCRDTPIEALDFNFEHLGLIWGALQLPTAGNIIGQRLFLVETCMKRELCSNLQRALERKVPTAATNKDVIITPLKLPFLGDNIPNTQVATSKLKLDFHGLSRLDARLLEATELSHGNVIPRSTDVQLRNLLTINIASVADLG
ncbi:hypothetical protein HG531_001466 [Fusarium graminearum]|nr:hypothetical protein HG531_001466 [Fusarium graminearum]